MEEPSKGTKLGKRSPCVHDMHLLLNLVTNLLSLCSQYASASEFGSILPNLCAQSAWLAPGFSFSSTPDAGAKDCDDSTKSKCQFQSQELHKTNTPLPSAVTLGVLYILFYRHESMRFRKLNKNSEKPLADFSKKLTNQQPASSSCRAWQACT